MLSEYGGTGSLSPSSSPEEILVNPLSSLGLEYDSLADFGPNVVSYPQNKDSKTDHNKQSECLATMRRMRRREQNRESFVLHQAHVDFGPQKLIASSHSQRRFRDRKESYTKQLEKKISELEGMSANLRSDLLKIEDSISQQAGGFGARGIPPKCPRCGLGDREDLGRSPRKHEGAVAG